jgi:hypothetical protein
MYLRGKYSSIYDINIEKNTFYFVMAENGAIIRISNSEYSTKSLV